MPEAIEGTVQGVNKNDRGVGFTLKGREGWYNFSKFLPREHQDGLTLPELPPEVREGQQVRFLYDVNKMGKSYIQVNPDGSHEFNVLDTTPPPQNGNSYEETKNDAIRWNVALKAATDLVIAAGSDISSSAVLIVAHKLYEGGPSSNGDPIKAASVQVPQSYETPPVPPVPVSNAAYADGDPGPSERPDAQ